MASAKTDWLESQNEAHARVILSELHCKNLDFNFMMMVEWTNLLLVRIC